MCCKYYFTNLDLSSWSGVRVSFRVPRPCLKYHITVGEFQRNSDKKWNSFEGFVLTNCWKRLFLFSNQCASVHLTNNHQCRNSAFSAPEKHIEWLKVGLFHIVIVQCAALGELLIYLFPLTISPISKLSNNSEMRLCLEESNACIYVIYVNVTILVDKIISKKTLFLHPWCSGGKFLSVLKRWMTAQHLMLLLLA